MRNVKLFAAIVACNVLVVVGGYAAADWSLRTQVTSAASAAVNRAAKQDRLDTGQVASAFEAVRARWDCRGSETAPSGWECQRHP